MQSDRIRSLFFELMLASTPSHLTDLAASRKSKKGGTGRGDGPGDSRGRCAPWPSPWQRRCRHRSRPRPCPPPLPGVSAPSRHRSHPRGGPPSSYRATPPPHPPETAVPVHAPAVQTFPEPSRFSRTHSSSPRRRASPLHLEHCSRPLRRATTSYRALEPLPCTMSTASPCARRRAYKSHPEPPSHP